MGLFSWTALVATLLFLLAGCGGEPTGPVKITKPMASYRFPHPSNLQNLPTSTTPP
jgi:hypothetical protein